MINSIFTEADAKAILAKAGFSTDGVDLYGIAWQMDDLAARIINKQWARRVDKKNRKPRKNIGREIRRELFLGLEHIWLDLPARRLAAVHTDPNKKRRTGPAVKYIQAYCGTLARYVRRMDEKHPSLTALDRVLSRIEANESGEIVREGLRISGFRHDCIAIAQKSPLNKAETK